MKLNGIETMQNNHTLDTALILALLCGVAYLGGCAKEHDLKRVNTEITLRLVGIDGCEYIEVQSMSKWNTDVHVTTYTHKGNCANPFHGYPGAAYATNKVISNLHIKDGSVIP